MTHHLTCYHCKGAPRLDDERKLCQRCWDRLPAELRKAVTDLTDTRPFSYAHYAAIDAAQKWLAANPEETGAPEQKR